MTEPIQTPSAPPRKRRRVLRIALGLLVLLLALVWFAPAIIARTSLRDQIVDSALADFNGKVRSESASMSWFGTVEFRNVTLAEPSGRVAVTAPKLTTTKTLWQLAFQRSDLGTFHIHEPDVTVSVENGRTNVEEWIANYTRDDGTPPKPERLAFAIEATNGKATLKGAPDTQLRNVTFAYRSPKSRAEPMEIRIAAEAADGGKLDTTVQLGTDTGVTLTAATFPLNVLDPVLPRFGFGLSVGGALTADVRGKWNLPADKPMSIEFSGAANVTDLAVRAPWLKGETLALKTFALLQSEVATLPGGRIDVKSLRVLCDVGDASLAGQFDPNFDADVLLKQPGIGATANVDLAKLAALLPKLLSIRDDTVLKRGALALTVNSEAGESGAVWAGELQTRDFEAERGGQILTWKTPLKAKFRGRFLADGRPDFDDLLVESEFLSVAGRGRLESFSVAGRFDLKRLAAQMGQFVDLGAISLAGGGTFRLNSKPVPDAAATAIEAKVDFDKIDIRDAKRTLAAHGRLTGTVVVNPTHLVGEKLRLELKDTKLAGTDFRFDEASMLLATSANFNRATGALLLTDAQLWTATIGLSSAKLDVARDDKLGYGVSGPVTVHAVVLEPVQRSLKLQKDPAGADVIRGIAKGTATIRANASSATIDADLKVENFSYGPAAKPTWSEPWVTVKGGGTYDFSGDTAQLKPTNIARDGFAVDAEGSLARLSTAMDLNLTGHLTYDLAKIEPQLKEYLGQSGRAAGRGTKPFAVSGNLTDGGKNVAVRVGGGPATNLDHLTGNAAVGWTSLKAYGFDVGEAELKANIDKGLVKLNRVDATFGSGRVHLEPTLALNRFYDLTFAKGTVVEKAKLSPAACAEAVGYALPAIANVAQAEGTISFELGENRIPLTDPTKGALVGTLLIHEAEVSPGPVVAKIAALLSAKPLKLQLTKDQRVPITFKDGRVYHSDFAIAIEGFTVKTSGSVGVDGSLALILEVPLNGKLASALVPADQPRVRDALAKQSVKIAITGTLAKPQLDPATFQKLVAETMRGALKEYAKGATEDFIKKGLEKFLPKK